MFYGMISVMSSIIFWIPVTDILKNEYCFLWYSLLLGWWISIFPTREYYFNNKEDLRDIF